MHKLSSRYKICLMLSLTFAIEIIKPKKENERRNRDSLREKSQSEDNGEEGNLSKAYDTDNAVIKLNPSL